MSAASATSTTKTLLTVREAANHLGISSQSVYRWIYSGQLPAVRYGTRIIRIHASDLENLATPVIEEQ